MRGPIPSGEESGCRTAAVGKLRSTAASLIGSLLLARQYLVSGSLVDNYHSLIAGEAVEQRLETGLFCDGFFVEIAISYHRDRRYFLVDPIVLVRPDSADQAKCLLSDDLLTGRSGVVCLSIAGCRFRIPVLPSLTPF